MTDPLGFFASPAPADAVFQLLKSFCERLKDQPLPVDICAAAFPVGILFARGDRGGVGADIAKQITCSFDFWDKDTGDSIDIVLAGWSKDENNVLKYNNDQFIAFKQFLESWSDWTFSGETDLLLLNFHLSYDTSRMSYYGFFNFSEVVVLPLETLIKIEQISSLDRFFALLAYDAKATSEIGPGVNSKIWSLSDRAGVRLAKKSIWCSLIDFITQGRFKEIEGIQNYAVKNLVKMPYHPHIEFTNEQDDEIRKMLFDAWPRKAEGGSGIIS